MFRLICIPQQGTSYAAEYLTQALASLDGEAIATIILSIEDPEFTDEQTAQAVAIRLGVSPSHAEKIKNLYTISEIKGLRAMGQDHVKAIVTNERGIVLDEKVYTRESSAIVVADMVENRKVSRRLKGYIDHRY